MSHDVTRKGQSLATGNLVKVTLFDGSIQVDDIDHHLETDFGGVNFVKDDDSESPFWSPGVVKVSCLIRVFGHVS